MLTVAQNMILSYMYKAFRSWFVAVVFKSKSPHVELQKMSLLWRLLSHILVWLKTMPSVPIDQTDHYIVSLVLWVLMIVFSFSFFLPEPQQHIEDRSCLRMLWPSSSVSREVSSISTDDTHARLFPLNDREMCIYCTIRQIFIRG